MDLDLGVYDYIRAIKKRWHLIFILCVVSTCISYVLTSRLPKIYQARTSLYVFAASPSKLGQLPSSLLNLVGGGGSGNEPEYLEKLLNSDSLTLTVVKNLKLDKIKEFTGGVKIKKKNFKFELDNPAVQKLIASLKSKVDIKNDKRGGMEIAVESQDPKLAAEIANTYVEVLRSKMTSKAKKNVSFLQSQLQIVQKKLSDAEDALMKFQKENDVLVIDKELESKVNQYLNLKSDELSITMALQSTQKLIEASGSLDELAKLEAQKISYQTKQYELQAALRNYDMDLKSYPEKSQKYAKLLREVRLQSMLFDLFSQQYETERISKLKEDIDFQVIDKAYPPNRHIKPQKKQSVAIALMISFVGGIFVVLVLEYLKTSSIEGKKAA